MFRNFQYYTKYCKWYLKLHIYVQVCTDTSSNVNFCILEVLQPRTNNAMLLLYQTTLYISNRYPSSFVNTKSGK